MEVKVYASKTILGMVALVCLILVVVFALMLPSRKAQGACVGSGW